MQVDPPWQMPWWKWMNLGVLALSDSTFEPINRKKWQKKLPAL
jgi:hypothetical protein